MTDIFDNLFHHDNLQLETNIDPSVHDITSSLDLAGDFNTVPEHHWLQSDSTLAWQDHQLIDPPQCQFEPTDLSWNDNADFSHSNDILKYDNLGDSWQQPDYNIVPGNDNVIDPAQWDVNFNHDFNINDGMSSYLIQAEVHTIQSEFGYLSKIHEYESPFAQEHAEMGSNGLSSLGIMRSGNSFQIKDELTKFSSQINNFGISHNEHIGTQDLKDTIERASKDPHFSSMTPDENWKPSDLITHGYENDLHSTTAENVMLGRFESLWKIDKNLAGFVVHDLPEPFQTNFITFLGASHGSNGGSYHLSNYGWEMK